VSAQTRARAPFLGRNAPPRKAAAARLSNSTAVGLAFYELKGLSDDFLRVSQVLEHVGNPHEWKDGRELRCQFARTAGTCDSSFSILSNEHLLEEVERLRSYTAALAGPACKACLRRYLEAPSEFIINGSHGDGVRLIHRPCQKKRGGSARPFAETSE